MGEAFPMGKRFIKRSGNKVMKIDFFTNKGRYIFDIEGIFISDKRIIVTFRVNRHAMSFDKVDNEFIRNELGEREVLKDIYIDKERILFF